MQPGRPSNTKLPNSPNSTPMTGTPLNIGPAPPELIADLRQVFGREPTPQEVNLAMLQSEILGL